jgi:hypothetical protein
MRLFNVAMFALALGAGETAAQGLSTEGPFSVNFTATGIDPQPPIQVGLDRDFGVYESLMLAVNADGEGLLHNMTGRCTGWYALDRTTARYEQHGHCNYVDADGDMIWEQFEFEPQQLSPVRMGNGRWLGGTGKYSGLRGEFEIRVRPLRPARDDVSQAIGSKQGSYRLPRRHAPRRSRRVCRARVHAASKRQATGASGR